MLASRRSRSYALIFPVLFLWKLLPPLLAAFFITTIFLLPAAFAMDAKEKQKYLTEIDVLSQKVNKLIAENRFKDAIPLTKSVAALREKVYGLQDNATIQTLEVLAKYYYMTGDNAEAFKVISRALQAKENRFGKNSAEILDPLNTVAVILHNSRNTKDAIPFLLRAISIIQDNPNLSVRLVDLQNILLNFAEFSFVLKDYVSAESAYLKWIDIQQRLGGGLDNANAAPALYHLGIVYRQSGRRAEAENLLEQALQIRSKHAGDDQVAQAIMSDLARYYGLDGNFNGAQLLFRRLYKAQMTTLGEDNPQTLNTLEDLANLQLDYQNNDTARSNFEKLFETRKRVLGEANASTLASMAGLAQTLVALKAFDQAEPLLTRLLEIREKQSGPNARQTLETAHFLGDLYLFASRFQNAAASYRKVIAQYESGADGKENLGIAINNLAIALYMQGKDQEAVGYLRRSIASERTRLGSGTSKLLHQSGVMLIRSLQALAPTGSEAMAEAFETAQAISSTEAAESLRKMAARSLAGEQAADALVREYETILVTMQGLYAEEQQARGAQGPFHMDELVLKNGTITNNPNITTLPRETERAREAKIQAKIAPLKARVTEIESALAQRFPDYAALIRPRPSPLKEVQARLGFNEALVLFVEPGEFNQEPQASFVWVVTQTAARWARIDLGTQDLVREVQALRCGLDRRAWSGAVCARLDAARFTAADAADDKPLPFDHERAYRLYKQLFGGMEELIKGKHLLLVPSSSLTLLPFQILITAPPAGSDHRAAAWLVRSNAVTILPEVASLQNLRRVGRPSHADRPLIGFGNPLLDGESNSPAYGASDRAAAQLAREKQTCVTPPWTARIYRWLGLKQRTAAAAFELRDSVARIDARRDVVDVAQIRRQTPLPETADELCTVARDVGADVSDIWLGARATEGNIKALSKSGELSKYRIVYFATHGAMAGEVRQTGQPGLILTPPAMPGEQDDGYLSAAEVAGLKLDADWVILSACNTAAGSATNAEALSGLARAFIYAKARALLVSHWAVNSAATVKLVAAAISEFARDKAVGRAEALRRAMTALIDHGQSYEAHPEFWSPFIVVGEGGR
jgi:tetratricopeptide (TPR) repeat protein